MKQGLIGLNCLLAWSIQTLMAAAGQAKQQKNPGAVVACIKQLDWMTGLGINSVYGSRRQRRCLECWRSA